MQTYLKYKINKKIDGLYPFNEKEFSSISDVLVINKKFSVKRKYNIKVIYK